MTPYSVKLAAQQAVSRAIAHGAIVRATTCELCGISPEPTEIRNSGRRVHMRTRIVLHHHDYSKPLDVIPLCTMCHRRVHSGRFPEPRTGRIYVSPATLAAQKRRQEKRELRERAPRAIREFAANHTVSRVSIGAKP